MKDTEHNGGFEAVRADWHSQMEVGLFLVQELQGVARSKLPIDEGSLRHLIYQIVNLMHTLLTGTAVVQVHLTYLDRKQ